MKPLILSLTDTLHQLLPRQTPADRAVLERVIEIMGGLEDLLACIRRHGDKHPRFQQLYKEWRTMFRERRKAAGYGGVLDLEKPSGIPATTLHAMETGHRSPTRKTMEALLGMADLNLDRQDLFVQIVLNR